MRESLIHKTEKQEEPLISPDPEHNKKKCCSLKCMAYSSLSIICVASIFGLIYVNVVCGNFNTDDCYQNLCLLDNDCSSGSTI